MTRFVLPARRFAPLFVAAGGALVVATLPRASRGHETIEEGATSASASTAPSEAAPPSAEVTVTAEKGFTAASADEVRNRDLALRPRVRVGDLLEVVPGLFAVQHAGGGKANQYFIRGFDADHGTDIALFVDGVPVNMPSHGHGQGFADLHFLIPELVSTLSAQKGPYSARYGDFATAAAVDLRLYDHLHESSVTYQMGSFGVFRGLFMVAPELGDDWSTIVAGEAYANDGPFTNAERLRRFNGFARVTRHMGPGTLSLSLMTYTSGWHASGQVPLRALGTPELPTEFDAIDPSEGGSTQRHQLSVAYHYLHDEDEARALVYAIKYRFTLFSDFTLYLNDHDLGDEIEQDDERTVLGTNWSFTRKKRLGSISTATTFGLQMRNDSIDNGLHHAFQRQITGDVLQDGVVESSVGLYVDEDVRITKWLRAYVGVRLDRFDVAVKDRLAAAQPGSDATGVQGSTLASPKLTWVLSPLEVADAKPSWLDLFDVYLNFGRGFHSNDARGATRQNDPLHPRVSLLTKASSWEVGTRLHFLNAIDFAAAAFQLDLESETVWNGDDGTTVAVGPTLRRGLELEARAKIWKWLFLDADATFTRATFKENAGNGGAIALAPTRTFAGGIGVRHPDGWFGSLRVRSIADRPANDGVDRAERPLDAAGWTLLDAMAGYRWRDLEFAVDVRNLLGTEWKEVQFANHSLLKSEVARPPPGVDPNRGVQDIHFTPGWPRTVLGRITAYF